MFIYSYLNKKIEEKKPAKLINNKSFNLNKKLKRKINDLKKSINKWLSIENFLT